MIGICIGNGIDRPKNLNSADLAVKTAASVGAISNQLKNNSNQLLKRPRASLQDLHYT
jgi:hypothetical protein